MRRFQLCFLVSLFVCLVPASVGLAAGQDLPFLYQRPNKGEVEVVTAMASYVFSEKEAQLKSLFLYYEAYGVRANELVPGIQQTELVQVDEKKLDPNYPILRRDRPILKPLTQFSFSFPAKAYAARRLYGEQTVFPFALSAEGMAGSFSLARWEKPPLYGKTRKFDRAMLRSPFSQRSHAADALRQLVSGTRAAHVFLSYSSEGILSREEILAILSTRGETRVMEIPYPVFGNGAGVSVRRNVMELLFHVETGK